VPAVAPVAEIIAGSFAAVIAVGLGFGIGFGVGRIGAAGSLDDPGRGRSRGHHRPVGRARLLPERLHEQFLLGAGLVHLDGEVGPLKPQRIMRSGRPRRPCRGRRVSRSSGRVGDDWQRTPAGIAATSVFIFCPV
jgi:hypothetical protein